MESIFDIFGSHDPVRATQGNPLPHTTAGKGLLSSKENIINGSNTMKGKKVLGDVGNKIRGLEKKLESCSETFKKSTQGSTSVSKLSHKTVSPENASSEKNPMHDDTKISLNFLWENGFDPKDIDKLPPVETQGPSFWADDDYESMWPKTESPVDEYFINAAKIWNIGTKYAPQSLRCPSPVSIEVNDNFDFCLDTPEIHTTGLVLEEVSVQVPWEI